MLSKQSTQRAILNVKIQNFKEGMWKVSCSMHRFVQRCESVAFKSQTFISTVNHHDCGGQAMLQHQT